MSELGYESEDEPINTPPRTFFLDANSTGSNHLAFQGKFMTVFNVLFSTRICKEASWLPESLRIQELG